ncbi:MAG TPA: glycosyltransferase family 87 protein [Alphaproteobacteria bacterium]|nr:glycosyltransferase family 87 protein [Alphaproteobacteria bacterium]
MRLLHRALTLLVIAVPVLFISGTWLPELNRVMHTGTTYRDSLQYYTGAYLVLTDQPERLYDLETHRALQDIWLPAEHRPHLDFRFLPFLSPPFVAWALAPLASLGLPMFYAVTGLGNWALLAILLGALRRLTSAWEEVWRLAALAFCLLWIPIVWTILQGQVSILLAVSFMLGFLALRSGKDATAGIVLALLWAKPQYAVLVLPSLLAWKRWRAAGSFAATSALLLLVSLAVVGLDGFLGYVGLLRRIETMGPLYAMFPASYHTLSGLLLRFFGIKGVPWLLLSGLLVGITLWSFAKQGFHPRSYALMIFMTVLVSPHTHIQDLAVLVPAIVLGGEALKAHRKLALLWTTLWSLVAMSFYVLAATPKFLQDSPLFTVSAMALSILTLFWARESSAPSWTSDVAPAERPAATHGR